MLKPEKTTWKGINLTFTFTFPVKIQNFLTKLHVLYQDSNFLTARLGKCPDMK
jgi:hypothetical protein